MKIGFEQSNLERVDETQKRELEHGRDDAGYVQEIMSILSSMPDELDDDIMSAIEYARNAANDDASQYMRSHIEQLDNISNGTIMDDNMRGKNAQINVKADKKEGHVKNKGLDSVQIAEYLPAKNAKNATGFNIPHSDLSALARDDTKQVQEVMGMIGSMPDKLDDDIMSAIEYARTAANGGFSQHRDLAPTTEVNSNPSPHNNFVNDELVRNFYNMGLCDDDGSLNRDDSKEIMRLRGEILAPGRVLTLYELTYDEIQILFDIVRQRETQNTSGQNHI